ncbi:MAG: phosphodiester glycosidase family protein [Deltaproteobacteria bacterium]|jgi:hypothetical protein|nr:phosphodiester glycosidase family protein [Deltaproteobacteria bacterium]
MSSGRAALALLLCACARPASAPPPQSGLSIAGPRSEVLGPGLELLTAELQRGSSPIGRLAVVYAEPTAITLDLLINAKRQALSELNDDALLVVNAGYFTKDWRPTGLLHVQGKTLSPLIKEGGSAGSGVLVVEGPEVRLVRRDVMAQAAPGSWALAIQAGPRVIEPDGEPGIRSDDGARANRTVLGRDGRGRLALAVTYDEDAGITSGPTLFELQRLLGLEGVGKIGAHLAFTAALNLDGGPSTGLHLNRPEGAIHWDEAGVVYSALVIKAAP